MIKPVVISSSKWLDSENRWVNIRLQICHTVIQFVSLITVTIPVSIPVSEGDHHTHTPSHCDNQVSITTALLIMYCFKDISELPKLNTILYWGQLQLHSIDSFTINLVPCNMTHYYCCNTVRHRYKICRQLEIYTQWYYKDDVHFAMLAIDTPLYVPSAVNHQ